MASNQKYPDKTANDIPSWVQVSLFEPVVRDIVKDFYQIKDFKVKQALNPGENFACIMLRVEVNVELKDGSIKPITLMLKTAHENGIFVEIMKSYNVFDTEAIIYRDLIPEFEQIYKNVDVDIRFAPKSYKLNTDKPHILLEDLKPRGFANVNRLEGLDMDHTHSVLKKLAQWHAVSATRVATKGPFSKKISDGYFTNEIRQLIKSTEGSSKQVQMDCIKKFEGREIYYDRMNEKKDSRVDELFDGSKADPSEFNVLNHGDCWSNNIMFKHDGNDKVVETYLIDYQVTHYGTPAQDLYYFLLSSTKYEFKISKFDYFIKYYHDVLTEHLTLLKYPKDIPSLKDIHIMLHKHNQWALHAVTGVMISVLLDPEYGAKLDDFIGESDNAMKQKIIANSNPRYRKHCEMLLPWLYYRGAI